MATPQHMIMMWQQQQQTQQQWQQQHGYQQQNMNHQSQNAQHLHSGSHQWNYLQQQHWLALQQEQQQRWDGQNAHAGQHHPQFHHPQQLKAYQSTECYPQREMQPAYCHVPFPPSPQQDEPFMTSHQEGWSHKNDICSNDHRLITPEMPLAQAAHQGESDYKQRQPEQSRQGVLQQNIFQQHIAQVNCLPLPPGTPSENSSEDHTIQNRLKGMVGEQPSIMCNMQQKIQTSKTSAGIGPATLGLMQARANMMAIFGVPHFQGQMSISGARGQDSRASVLPTTPVFATVASIFKRPGRLKRPPRIFIILRGLPGAGKSRVARTLRDIEVANGGEAPRVLSLDDYFLQEFKMQKIDEDLGKEVTVTEMRYVHDLEMEDVYKASVLKAVKKTIDQGLDKLIIYDAQNVRTEDFEDMWKYAKTKGYETFVMEVKASVAECVSRNVHKRTRDEIALMAQEWEETPVYISKLTGLSTVLQIDKLSGVDIREVEMDHDDEYEPGLEAGFTGSLSKVMEPGERQTAVEEGRCRRWLEDEEEDKDGIGESTFKGSVEVPKRIRGVLRNGSSHDHNENLSRVREVDSVAVVQLVDADRDDENENGVDGLMSLMGAYDDDDPDGCKIKETEIGMSSMEHPTKSHDSRAEKAEEREGAHVQKRKVRWMDEDSYGNIESYDYKRQKIIDAGRQAQNPLSAWALKLMEEQKVFAAAMKDDDDTKDIL